MPPTGLLADVHCVAHLAAILRHLERDWRRELWLPIALPQVRFADVGLALDATDREVWGKCRTERLVLVTANRNDDGPDSLEATLAGAGEDALPVVTLSDPARVLLDRDYRERAADRLLELLFDVDRYRGVGRLFVP